MRTFCSTVLLFGWGIWIGGVVTLFVFLQKLFGTDREIAKQAAPLLIRAFEREHVILAIVSVTVAAILRKLQRRRSATFVLSMLVLAAIFAGVSAMAVTPHVEALRQAGQTMESPAFRQWHGISMGVYFAETVMLAIAGLVLPTAMGPRSAQRG